MTVKLNITKEISKAVAKTEAERQKLIKKASNLVTKLQENIAFLIEAISDGEAENDNAVWECKCIADDLRGLALDAENMNLENFAIGRLEDVRDVVTQYHDEYRDNVKALVKLNDKLAKLKAQLKEAKLALKEAKKKK